MIGRVSEFVTNNHNVVVNDRDLTLAWHIILVVLYFTVSTHEARYEKARFQSGSNYFSFVVSVGCKGVKSEPLCGWGTNI